MRKSLLFCLRFSVFGFLFSACGYDDFGPYADPPAEPVESNIDMATLRGYYGASPLDVSQELVVRGVVTSSDRGNNFYRTLLVEDATGAIELLHGLYDSHNVYPPGQRVALRLKGLRLDLSGGVMQAGAPAPASSYYAIEYLGAQAIVDRHLIREGVYAPFHPALLAIPQLTEAMCGRLVSVAGLTFVPDSPLPTWANPSAHPDYPPTDGYRKFRSAAGDELYVLTSGYADFTADPVPQGSRHTITGILMRTAVPGSNGRAVWVVKIRDLGDVE